MKPYVKLMRPKHWVKNVFVIAPLLFSGRYFELDSDLRTAVAFVVFCLVASATYAMNDIFDVESDRAHPTKSTSRPIAAGTVSIKGAWRLFGFLIAAAAALLFLFPALVPVVAAYLLLQVAYNLYLKRQPVIEFFAVALGFVLRVYAGAFSIEVPVSKWMFVTTFSLALFLASVKRFQELKNRGDNSRKVLAFYSVAFTQRVAEISGTLAVVFYSFFTIAARPAFIYTIPVVVFGLIRYWYVAEQNSAGESPTDLLLRDKQLLLAGALLVFMVAWSLLTNVQG